MILRKLEKLKNFAGYLGAGVFTPDGDMVGGVTEVSGINFEIAGSLFHDAYLVTNNNTREAGFGYTNMIQVDTDMGIIFAKCIREEGLHFHTILVVKNDANIAMAKLMLSRVVDSLREDFQEPDENS